MTALLVIHSNDESDEINEFHYLRASLEGSAAVFIQSFEFSANNYSAAWNILCERFNNKRLLIQNHVSALFNIECVPKKSFSLKRLVDTLNKNLRSLESLGEPVQHWGTLTYREWEEFKGRINKDAEITFFLFLVFTEPS